ncbi:uncharacterized protein NECHADRAFT_74169 [Fusarium vanettenii 77-13-4]|uniref:Uncharacterized protein n=1 Tax=Fusarium vanettenii (strain ATCC MYA-4622 / CBS 123669 / FGSC 9596 / NRRL 45880 / 77-13-4) TaxID=660122 RepID=C7YW36_FUSV7|nr:uncharacterized protein NECHADRAFT_74169 [Fusarium vanettenii 77-13-4]EEU44105.1 hypothetical protein NECHADRAFT_74169 [Fusarium vanettenii 77-13-4]
MWSLCKIAFSIQVALGTVSAALIPATRFNQDAVWPQRQAPVEDQLFLSPTTQFTKVQQNDSLCDARSRQWTGKVPVTNGNSLFYWYFESQRYPERAPTILYLTGGPAEASAQPMLTGVGPCLINKHGNDTTFNPFSWTRYYNVIFVDEVAGSGFSKTPEGVDFQPTTAHEVASDVKVFLHKFSTEIFPELGNRAAVPQCETEVLQCRLAETKESCDKAMEACGPIMAAWYPPKHNLVNISGRYDPDT